MEISCSPEEAVLLVGLARQFDVMLKNKAEPTWLAFKGSFAWAHMRRELSFKQRLMAEGLWARLYEEYLKSEAAG